MKFSPELLALVSQKAVEHIMDVVAKDGLVALKNILDNSGFADSPYLKDYEIECEVIENTISFSLTLNEKAISDESKRKMRPETDDKFRTESSKVTNRYKGKEFANIYTMGPDGRPMRIQGSRNAIKQRKEARRFTKDGRKISKDRDITDRAKNSGERYVEHELEAIAPRGMEVEKDGKLRITMQREIRNTSHKVIFPQGDYQGIVKKLIEDISQLMQNSFSKELTSILSGYSK